MHLPKAGWLAGQAGLQGLLAGRVFHLFAAVAAAFSLRVRSSDRLHSASMERSSCTTSSIVGLQQHGDGGGVGPKCARRAGSAPIQEGTAKGRMD